MSRLRIQVFLVAIVIGIAIASQIVIAQRGRGVDSRLVARAQQITGDRFSL
jgi:hypothetical protein